MAAFVADVHLAKLAKLLRLLGFDTLYFNHIEDDELLKISENEKRWILTKDRALCTRAKNCLLVKAKEPKEQLKEVLYTLKLTQCRPFTRCLVDNAPLERVPKEEVLAKIPPKVAQWCEEFQWCPECGRIYWKGSHYDRMKKFIDEVCG